MWHRAIEALAMLAAAAVLWMLAKARKALTTFGHGRASQIPGLPLIGNTLALARHGASYIHKCRLQVYNCSQLLENSTLSAVAATLPGYTV